MASACVICAAETTLAMLRYDRSEAGGPMQIDSSANNTPSESRSASECAITVLIPSSLQARITRTAISPRLATRSLLNMGSGIWDLGFRESVSERNPKSIQLAAQRHCTVDERCTGVLWQIT